MSLVPQSFPFQRKCLCLCLLTSPGLKFCTIRVYTCIIVKNVKQGPNNDMLYAAILNTLCNDNKMYVFYIAKGGYKEEIISMPVLIRK